MNVSHHLLRFFFCLAMVAGSNLITAQSSTFEEGRFSIGAGIGWDYGAIGVTGKYFFHNNIAVTATLIMPTIGVEANAPIAISDKLVTFVTVKYGLNNSVRLSNNELDPFGGPTVTKQKLFTGFIYGFGLKYKYNKDKRRYLTLSANYVHRLSNVSEFIEEFNQEQNTFYSIEPKDFIRPSLGLVFYFDGK